MKKFIAFIILLLIGTLIQASPTFATSPYRPRKFRDIDSDYRLKADDCGFISLHQRQTDETIFEVQGSGNSEYCAKKKYVFIRVVPLAEIKNEENGEDEQNSENHWINYAPEDIHLPGQPYDYYIFKKETKNIIGPLTESEFAAHDLVSKQKIKWKFIEATKKGYRTGMIFLGIYILFALFYMYVLPFLILLAVIIFILRVIFKKKHKAVKTE